MIQPLIIIAKNGSNSAISLKQTFNRILFYFCSRQYFGLQKAKNRDRGTIIQSDQCTTAAQDEGEWRRMAKQGTEHFMEKWIAAEKARAGLRHTAVCPNATGWTKERIVQRKWARADLLTIVD